jgi:hypothetical protein
LASEKTPEWGLKHVATEVRHVVPEYHDSVTDVDGGPSGHVNGDDLIVAGDIHSSTHPGKGTNAREAHVHLEVVISGDGDGFRLNLTVLDDTISGNDQSVLSRKNVMDHGVFIIGLSEVMEDRGNVHV